MSRASISPAPRPSSLAPRGFTLVELLVVIAIVGMLAGLITAAAWRAVVAGKNTVITVEVSQLDAACKAYKEKFGEYPPDFAGLDDTDPVVVAAVQQTIMRHLSKAFPRYQPGVSTIGVGNLNGWDGLAADILGDPSDCVPGYEGWNINIDTLSPAHALAFFLGGKPYWRVNSDGNPILPGATTPEPFDPNLPVKGLLGYSANPLNPFDNSPSRIRPFYEFDINSLGWLPTGGVNGGIAYWPKVQAVTTKATAGPVIYFRAENGNYTNTGNIPVQWQAWETPTTIKNCSGIVWPAIDTRLSTLTADGNNATVTWMNPQSFQIFTSGLDLTYGILTDAEPGDTDPFYGLQFPAGNNYGTQTFDDITNFSGGTLESAME